MTVHFIGAGPGAPDLVTVRGLRLIQRAPVILYAGSLVPRELLAEARPDAEVVDTASLHLAIAEQMRRLDALAIAYEIVPGVPAYAAAAADLKRELTLPGVGQSVILTRTAVRASSMPAGETLENFARTGATLAIHLSINNLAKVVRELTPYYGADTPVVVAYRVGWPDGRYIHGTLADIRGRVKDEGITRTALILVGRVLDPDAFADSRLYAADHHHVCRDASS